MFSAPDALLTNESAPSKTPRRTPGQDSKAAAPPARKSCNCRNSRCLKLYCECFASGQYCFACNCQGCYNNPENDDKRKLAIQQTLERNPQAFRPKIGAGSSDSAGRHNKGCHCKKSGCLKKYCECFQAGIACSDQCKCSDCRNRDPVRTAPTRPHSLNHPILLHPAHVLGPLCALFAGGHCCWSLTIAGGEAATTRRAGDRRCGRDATPTSHSKSACNSSVCRCSRQPCSSSATGCRCDEFAASARAKGYRRLHRR